MQNFAVDLVANGVAVADTAAKTWPGGRAVIVVVATAFPTTCQVQFMSPDGTNWLSVGSNLTANGISSGIDLPAGQIRLHCTGGTETALYVTVASVPY